MVFWDVAQQLQIRQMRGAQQMGEREGFIRDQRQEARADELEDRIQQVLLVTEALWSLCRDRLGLTDDQLKVAMQEVLDRHQARADAAPTRCTSCGAAVPHDMVRCQYCGTDTGATPELFR
jgi:hypothetical protein